MFMVAVFVVSHERIEVECGLVIFWHYTLIEQIFVQLDLTNIIVIVMMNMFIKKDMQVVSV